MKSEFFQRSPRIKKQIPQKLIEVHSPPPHPVSPNFSVVSIIVPLIMTVVTISLYIYINTSMSRSSNPTYLYFQMISMGMMMVSYTIPFFVYLSNKRGYKKQLQERTKAYREQLEKHREELKASREEQRQILREIDPDPQTCLRKIVQRDSSLWERSPRDEDFLSLRLGIGERLSSVAVKVPKRMGYEQEPLLDEAEQLAQEYEMVPDVPIHLPLLKARVVGIVGQRADVLNTVRAIALQLVTHHSPDELKLGAFFHSQETEQWSWLRWVPHIWNDDRTIRYMANQKGPARQLLDTLYAELNRRRINKGELGGDKLQIPNWVFFLSAPHLVEDEPILPLLLKDAEAVGACTVLLADSKDSLPMHCSVIVEAGSNTAKLVETEAVNRQEAGGIEHHFTPDQVPLELVDQAARQLAPLRLKRSMSSELPKVLTLLDMFAVNRVEELDVLDKWKKNRYPQTLPVPVGVKAGGKLMVLNIHDKIERKGHGPHGLMAGTTGSGKSEVIQSIVASLAVHYHPHELAFLLIDYKGGGMSNTFHDLPHLVGAITNLEGGLIERAKVSLRAELVRRQRIFNEAGNLQHIDEYYQSPWRERHPLPHLIIIIDEFAQLKKDQPEFMNELISIAAIGRTLGVHLLLATQKPGGVVDDKIWSNSRFRICLRVQDDADSREMLKLPNAAWITTPGRGYLQVGSNEEFELVQYAWSGAPYQPDRAARERQLKVVKVELNGQRSAFAIKGQEQAAETTAGGQKQLQALIGHLSRLAKQEGIASLPGPWLPPLPTTLFLEDLYAADGSGWNGRGWRHTERWLEAPVGLVDDLANQKQEPLVISLEEGHLPIYGMPGTGKTTFVQTLILSLALRYSPKDLHMYVLDFGRMMRDFAKLPHIGSVIQDDERDKVQRLFRFLLRELTRRRELLANVGAKTLTAYRQATGDEIPAIVVCIDGYLNFRNAYEQENMQLEQLLREGGSVGIIFVVTANRITDIFDRVRSNFALGVCFELAEPGDYYFAVGRPSKPPVNLPEGRGLVKGTVPPLEFQTALPAKGETETERIGAMRSLIQQMDEAWTGERAAAIKTLPEEIWLEDLLAPNLPSEFERTAGKSRLKVPIALDIDDLTPFAVDLEDGPYFLVGSPLEGGKTSLLLTWILSLATHNSPRHLDLYLIDYRPTAKGLAAVRSLPHVKGYADKEEEVREMLQHLTQMVAGRNATAKAEETGQSGELHEEPAIVLVIDDADLFYRQLTDYQLKDQLTQLLRQGRTKRVYVMIAGVPNDFPYSSNDWLADIKGMQTGFLLASLDSNDLSVFRIPSTEMNHYATNSKILPSGQGYFAKRRFCRIKAALPFSEQRPPAEWVKWLDAFWHPAGQNGCIGLGQ
ncbi:type VII secretion protein EssC [Brevibacillus fulvus]|uniref:S-DNA-T family DNA segregation ATPase FtsK/SpoIIIE n=1 Tax=Brevibacillus fulvus TaxID=1125967 RepID=A0A939BNY4_9BACL|nr:type VII secretion protein EssC [Brevibacillus fulvus]MBM7589800.1 S-DNA-T family DNA segregation ATPase FtsK/SpoIIIE [Brevibacillus fulvus]